MTVYLASEEFENELEHELGSTVVEKHGRLYLTEGAAIPSIWARNIWHDAIKIPIASIGDAAKRLREIQPLWQPYSNQFHRRCALIQDKLPKVRIGPQDYLSPLPDRKLGSWSLLAPDLILAAANCESVFANGEFVFNEDRSSAPSRAYLKLWELFTLYDVCPKPGDRCLDLGSSPGGWTWVLAQLGCEVISVDKAHLDPRIAKLPNVKHLKQDAFTLRPEDVGPIDWLFSDIICYPKDLFTLTSRWRESGLCQNFACTIKYQGETDFETTEKFLNVPGSRLKHLIHNKHEITWWNLKRSL